MRTPPENPSEIQILINSYRGKYDLSQEEMASILHATQEQVCKWERGTHNPSPLRLSEMKRRLTRYDKRHP